MEQPNNNDAKKLENTGSDGAEEEFCAICLDQMKGSSIASLKICKHSFCLGCLLRWSLQKNTCPLCRAKYGEIELATQQNTRQDANHRDTVRVDTLRSARKRHHDSR